MVVAELLLDVLPPIGLPPEPPPTLEFAPASAFAGGKPAEGAELHAVQIDVAIAHQASSR